MRSLGALDRYPWTGHSAVLGHIARPWQATQAVLGQFAERRSVARRRYWAFVAAGIGQGRRPELQGGGLRRSAGGWTALAALRRGRERWAFDERILGSGPFVEQLLREAERAAPLPGRAAAWRSLPGLIARVATAPGVNPQELRVGSRLRPVARTRAAVGALAVRHLGLPASGAAAALGVTSKSTTPLMNVERCVQDYRGRLPSEWKNPEDDPAGCPGPDLTWSWILSSWWKVVTSEALLPAPPGGGVSWHRRVRVDP